MVLSTHAAMPASRGTILLTGANGGLGSAIVSRIISMPEFRHHHGIYTLRNANSSASVLDVVLEKAASPTSSATPAHTHEKIFLDFSKLDTVREVASSLNQRVAAGQVPPICAIILNAGYEEFRTQTWTEDGLDTTFVKNYLGHWLLVLLLLQSMDREKGRVVWISIFSHNPKDPRSVFIRSHDEDKYKTVISRRLGAVGGGHLEPEPPPHDAFQAMPHAYTRFSPLREASCLHTDLRNLMFGQMNLTKLALLSVAATSAHAAWQLRGYNKDDLEVYLRGDSGPKTDPMEWTGQGMGGSTGIEATFTKNENVKVWFFARKEDAKARDYKKLVTMELEYDDDRLATDGTTNWYIIVKGSEKLETDWA
ncbi:Uu.00g142030.m01.CDS01 [Anthostomella pinea]|uniref:Uu.00g142030.m01.CDS01 n=1 Tax=Anthostomella pinea TaxID=933095 RepID=A0AAI8VRK4_9PEZI|nr:Uu.00g142030.m01.CDS01 [Anthostomella pinea]